MSIFNYPKIVFDLKENYSLKSPEEIISTSS